MSVEGYRQKMELYMMRVGIREEEEKPYIDFLAVSILD